MKIWEKCTQIHGPVPSVGSGVVSHVSHGSLSFWLKSIHGAGWSLIGLKYVSTRASVGLNVVAGCW